MPLIQEPKPPRDLVPSGARRSQRGSGLAPRERMRGAVSPRFYARPDVGYADGVTFRAKVTAIALAPVAFWLLATATEVVRHKPDALETPVLYLAATWLLYAPVFALAGLLPIAIAPYSKAPIARWLCALATGCFAAGITRAAITSSISAALECGFVAALLGAMVAANEGRGRSARII